DGGSAALRRNRDTRDVAAADVCARGRCIAEDGSRESLTLPRGALRLTGRRRHGSDYFPLGASVAHAAACISGKSPATIDAAESLCHGTCSAAGSSVGAALG